MTFGFIVLKLFTFVNYPISQTITTQNYVSSGLQELGSELLITIITDNLFIIDEDSLSSAQWGATYFQGLVSVCIHNTAHRNVEVTCFILFFCYELLFSCHWLPLWWKKMITPSSCPVHMGGSKCNKNILLVKKNRKK